MEEKAIYKIKADKCVVSKVTWIKSRVGTDTVIFFVHCLLTIAFLGYGLLSKLKIKYIINSVMMYIYNSKVHYGLFLIKS